MSTDADAIRAQIETTRADLSDNVNTLADTVNPVHAAKRQVGKVKGAVTGVREKVMGSADDAREGLAAGQHTVTAVVAAAPDQIRARTAGNPLAVGLIAFGIGWLAGSLLPTTTAEQQAATKVKDTAAPVLADAAKDVADNMKEPAQEAMDAIKHTATDAATSVKDEGTSAANDLTNQARGQLGT